MKLLLDTHIWLWGFLEPDRISRRVRRELLDQANERWLSPISVWELFTLHKKGRIVLDSPAQEWAMRAMASTTEAPLTHEVALETQALTMGHRDPADRFLVASARVFGLTLVTADVTLIEAKNCPILASR
jgi:PIN domain nuclease of toxin-antitoxin system